MRHGATSKKTISGNRAPAMYRSASTTAAVLGLSLVTWLGFYFLSMPLDVPGTTVVVGGWLLLVVAGQWAWAHIGKSPRRRTRQ
jgi:hypothetical protein